MAVGEPNATVAIDKHCGRVEWDGATEESAVPIVVGVTGGKEAAADVDVSECAAVVEDYAGQTKHQQKEADNDASPLMVFCECFSFH